MRLKYVLAASILVTFLIYLLFCNFSVYGNKLETVSVGGQDFRAEVVRSLEKREKGLGGRKSLCEECAMLFVFPKGGEWGFWMKNMNFDLDIIWIKEDKIVKIVRNVSKNYQEVIAPDIEADNVLEINSGLSDKFGIKRGDKIIFK